MISPVSKRPRARLAAAPLLIALALLAACAHRAPPKPSAAQPQSASEALLHDRKAIAAAQRALRQLGYGVKAADGIAGAETEKALRAYQKDERIAADGRLTGTLAERLKSAAAKLPGKNWALSETGLEIIYSDGADERLSATGAGMASWETGAGKSVTRPANFLLVADEGADADAPANFMQPLKPGTQGSYHIHRGASLATVTCSAGHLTRIAVKAGNFDAIETLCREESAGRPPVERRIAYAPALRLVIREEAKTDGQEAKSRELVATRPATQSWPAAARAGFDWAMTHALESPDNEEPVIWSSTGVEGRFQIRAERDAPAAAAPHCVRYEITRTDPGAGDHRYPGLACPSETGAWLLPAATPVLIARPAAEIPPEAAATGLRPAKSTN